MASALRNASFDDENNHLYSSTAAPTSHKSRASAAVTRKTSNNAANTASVLSKGSGNGDSVSFAPTKTPARSARRAFGDISNRKQQLPPPPSSAAKGLMRSTATATKPTTVVESSRPVEVWVDRPVIVASNRATTTSTTTTTKVKAAPSLRPAALPVMKPEPQDIPEIEHSAGRMWTNQQAQLDWHEDAGDDDLSLEGVTTMHQDACEAMALGAERRRQAREAYEDKCVRLTDELAELFLSNLEDVEPMEDGLSELLNDELSDEMFDLSPFDVSADAIALAEIGFL